MGRIVSVMRVARQRLFGVRAARFWSAAPLAAFLLGMMVTSRAAGGSEGTYSFAGTVVDPQGKPVAGAKVWFDYWLAREPAQPALRDAVSDAQGKFQFSRTKGDLADMAENSLWTNIGLVATKEGYGFAAGPVERFETTGRLVVDRPELFRRRVGRAKREAERGDRILTLVADDVPLQGALVNADGRPVAGATVEVVAVWEGEKGTLDEWEAAVRKEPAWRFVSPLFWRYAGPGAIMYLNGRRWFAGPVRLCDARAVPVAGVRSDGQGRFSLKGIGRERLVEMLIRAPGCESVQKLARTRGGETINPQNGGFRFEQIVPDKFTSALGPSVPVEGNVVESGTGRALAEVRVRSSTALAASTVTDAWGHYRLEGIPIGRTWIDLIPPSGSRNFPVEVDVFTRADAATVVRDITVPAGALVRGRAIDQRTGKPLQGSLFYFAWESNPELKKVTSVNLRRRPYSPFQTDAQGRFAIPTLAGPGILGFRAGPQFHYGVGADRIDCPVEEMYGGGKVFRTLPDLCSAQSFNLLVPLDPRPGEGDLTIDLTLRSGVDVTARVTALDGQPLGEYYVLGASRDVFWSEQSQDRFTIVGCYPEETCRVLLYQPARNLVAFADVTGIPPEPIEIRLRPGASIAGRVLDDDGLPLANANLVTETTKLRAAVGHLAEMKRDRGLFPQVPPTFRTDDKGRFEIKGIIPGLKYTARIQVTRGSTLLRTVPIFTDVTAKSGETKDLGDVRPAPPEDRRTQ